MTKVDLIALGFVALTAFIGWKKGLIASAFSLAGIVLGGWLGSRLAPQLLQGGTHSPYTPLAALAGAAVGAILFETLGTLVGSALRSRVRRQRMSTFDAGGGLILGAFAGVAVVWVLGAVALLLPGQTDLRRGAQGSALLQRLNEFIPPTDVLNALARIDPFPSITVPAAQVAAPDPRLAHAVGVRRAAPSVVRVLGLACGVGVEGTGWVAKPDLIVTAAHVVAGQSDTVVELQSGGRLPADVVAFDRRNDVAVLRVRDLGVAPAAVGFRQVGCRGCGAGLPRERAFHRDPGANRAHVDGPGGGRVRERTGDTHDHLVARSCQARRLGRTGGRHAGGSTGDDLRGSCQLDRRLRCPGRRCARRPQRRRKYVGLDRRLRSLRRARWPN